MFSLNIKLLKRSVLLFAAVLMLASSVFLIPPSNTAAKSVSDMTPAEEASSATYYTALATCAKEAMLQEIITVVGDDGEADPTKVGWFNTGGAFSPNNTFTVFDGANSVKKECNQIVKLALQLWGWGSDYKGFLTSLGYTYDQAVPQWKTNKDGDSRFNTFTSLIQSKVYKLSFNLGFSGKYMGYRAPISEAGTYALYQPQADTCKIQNLGLYPDGIKDATVKGYVDSGATVNSKTYTKKTWFNSGGVVAEYGLSYQEFATPVVIYGTTPTRVTAQCSSVVDELSSSTTGWIKSLGTEACKAIGVEGQINLAACADGYLNTDISHCAATYASKADERRSCYIGQGREGAEACVVRLGGTMTKALLNACIDGSKNKDTAYCASAYRDVYSAGKATIRDAEREACQFGQSLKTGPTITKTEYGDDCGIDSSAEGCDEEKTTCAIGGVGWIICPAVNFVAGLTDASFDFLSNSLLRTDVGILQANSDNGAYVAWGIVRSIANVAFVIVFLVIIFSQLTGAGISNYGIKKMIPRLVVGAILVNLSFFLCQVAVDISNILGYSIRSVFDSVSSQVNIGYDKSDPLGSATGDSLLGLFGSVLAIGTAAAAGYFLIASGGTLLLAALVALLVTLLILILRQAIIILAIVIAPIAFVAWILPNTEKLFKQWLGIFAKLLLVFPIIAAIFGASILASNILAKVAWEQGDLFGQIIAHLIPGVALLAVIPAIQGSIKAIPMIGEMAGKMTGKANGGLGRAYGESRQNSMIGRTRAIRKQSRATTRDRNLAEGLSGTGVRGKVFRAAAGGLSTLGITKQQRAEKEALERAAKGTAASAQSDAVKQEMVLLREKVGSNPNSVKNHIMSNHGSMSATQMEAASDLMLEAGGTSEYRDVIKNPSVMGIHARSLVESGRRNDSTLRLKAADMANWASTASAATHTGGYDGATTQTEPDGKGGTTSYVEQAYSSAEAGKLLTMDAATAEIASGHIDKKQAEFARDSDKFSDAKTGTQEVLRRITGR